MGKRKKEHRKKVAARNQLLKGQKSAMQKLFDETMRQQLEKLKKDHGAENADETKPTE